jgi:hypothetical protein
MAEKPEQQPRRLPARGGKRRIARQQRFRIAMGNLHQPRKLIRVFPRIKQPGAGQPGLARAQSIAAAARFQILLSDHKAIFRIAQHQKARAAVTDEQVAAFMAVLRGRATRAVPLAVEIRDPELASAPFAAGLRDAGAVPCLAVHARMPPVAEQAAAFGLDRDDCPLPLVARWNLHAGRDYDGAKADYFPFNRLVEEDVPSRSALAHLARAAAAGDSDVFITINNKAEGSAPRSVALLAAGIV